MGCIMGLANPILKLSCGLENHGSNPWDLNFMKIKDINLMLKSCQT